ncbi:hypothetical protein F4604DRAFT_309509 [Suillus subluteus]|nr:hypothetical protein F4604DRAFT_309509 [Suillus subluteus]
MSYLWCADCKKSYLYWQNSELYNHVKASQEGQLQATTSDGQSTQPNYLPSAPVNSYEDPTPADTQHQVIAAGQPSHDGFSTQIRCLWPNHQGQCGVSEDTTESILTHISRRHLPKTEPCVRVQCSICSPPKTLRRDTILRHIREQHYEDNSRRQHPS